jgi:hypothetical protein
MITYLLFLSAASNCRWKRSSSLDRPSTGGGLVRGTWVEVIGPAGGPRFRDSDNFDIVKKISLNDFLGWYPAQIFFLFWIVKLPWFNDCFWNLGFEFVVVVVKARHFFTFLNYCIILTSLFKCGYFIFNLLQEYYKLVNTSYCSMCLNITSMYWKLFQEELKYLRTLKDVFYAPY